MGLEVVATPPPPFQSSIPLCPLGARSIVKVTWAWPPLRHSAQVHHLVIRRSRATHPFTPMSSKQKKLTAKRGRASEESMPNFNLTKFVNEGAIDRFGTIYKK